MRQFLRSCICRLISNFRIELVNVGAGGFVAVFKGALLLGLAPEDLVVAVGVKGRINVNQIHAGVGQFGELFQVVTAINDAGVQERGRFRFYPIETARGGTLAPPEDLPAAFFAMSGA